MQILNHTTNQVNHNLLIIDKIQIGSDELMALACKWAAPPFKDVDNESDSLSLLLTLCWFYFDGCWPYGGLAEHDISLL